MKRLTLLLTSAVAALIALGGSVRADQIAWQYTWSPNPVSIVGSGGGGISFTTESNTQNAAGNSDIVATNLFAFSTAQPGSPEQLVNGAYSLTLTLIDGASQQSGSLTFGGTMSGTFSQNNTNLTNVFNQATQTQSIVLGGNTYAVTINSFSPPGPPLSGNLYGGISAFVQVTGGGGGVGIQDVPEPSTMVLAGVGLSFLGGAAWRKRRLLMAKAAE
jgi:PEP-CTERM motif